MCNIDAEKKCIERSSAVITMKEMKKGYQSLCQTLVILCTQISENKLAAHTL